MNDPLEICRHIEVDASRRGGLAIKDGVVNEAGRRSLERSRAGSHLVKNGAQGKDIRPPVDRFSPDLLGRHANDGARRRIMSG